MELRREMKRIRENLESRDSVRRERVKKRDNAGVNSREDSMDREGRIDTDNIYSSETRTNASGKLEHRDDLIGKFHMDNHWPSL